MNLADRPRIAIVGAGRVGNALALALHKQGYVIGAVTSRTIERAKALAKKVDAVVVEDAKATFSNADLIIIATPDGEIRRVCESLAGDLQGHGVIHTAGALGLDVLAAAQQRGAMIGGLHPMRAISDTTIISPPSPVPDTAFGLETDSPVLRAWLLAIVKALNGYPFWLSPESRPLYHAAAVLVSNYSVTLFAEAQRLLSSLEQQGNSGANSKLDDERLIRLILVYLLESTLANLRKADAPHALTGPIVRGDVDTVQAHLAALDRFDSELAMLYRALGQRTLPLAAQRGTKQEYLDRLDKILRKAPHADDHTDDSEDAR